MPSPKIECGAASKGKHTSEMSNMMTDLSITLHLINGDDTKDDAMVRIRKNLATNDFELTFTDPNMGSKIVHSMSGLYRQKVLDYIYYLLKNQYLDEEGFDKLQVDLPAMPTMIVSGSSMRDIYYRDHFYGLIGFGLDSLESTTKIVEKPACCSSTKTCASYFKTPVAPPSLCRPQTATSCRLATHSYYE